MKHKNATVLVRRKHMRDFGKGGSTNKFLVKIWLCSGLAARNMRHITDLRIKKWTVRIETET